MRHILFPEEERQTTHGEQIQIPDVSLLENKILTEDRIREIFREELAAWEKRQRQTRGWTTMETK